MKKKHEGNQHKIAGTLYVVFLLIGSRLFMRVRMTVALIENNACEQYSRASLYMVDELSHVFGRCVALLQTLALTVQMCFMRRFGVYIMILRLPSDFL